MASVLRQLAGLQAPGALVTFSRWSWVLPMADAFLAALPGLQVCRFAVDTWLLTDELLAALMRMGPHVRSVRALSASEVLLDTQANLPWPWEKLAIEATEVSTVVRLPKPKPGTLFACHNATVDAHIEQVCEQQNTGSIPAATMKHYMLHLGDILSLPWHGLAWIYI